MDELEKILVENESIIWKGESELSGWENALYLFILAYSLAIIRFAQIGYYPDGNYILGYIYYSILLTIVIGGYFMMRWILSTQISFLI